MRIVGNRMKFPFLFGGTFIEGARRLTHCTFRTEHFPSFSEGLSLRDVLGVGATLDYPQISLPFRRDFH